LKIKQQYLKPSSLISEKLARNSEPSSTNFGACEQIVKPILVVLVIMSMIFESYFDILKSIYFFSDDR
jgi:hypothetical protein